MIEVGEWERGFKFSPVQSRSLRMYLWFYEWNLFDAVYEGQHTPGDQTPSKMLDSEHHQGKLSHPNMSLFADSTKNGVDLLLTITNETNYDWPLISGIIPCFNPGGLDSCTLVGPTPQFFDDSQERTWFLGQDGLERLENRAIHFNEKLRKEINQQASEGQFVFSEKWPTSKQNASIGLIVRESSDKGWVSGIGWEQFIAVQAHNPWRCMHVSICVGPLKQGQTKEIKGKVYIFPGSKETCFEKFLGEFGS